MKPSFFSLFKRGKYYHRKMVPKEEGKPLSEAETHERKEGERFVVAAIAFCLQHDDRFRTRFFQNICQFAGDPPLSFWQIDIEPHDSSDLVLYNKAEAGTYAYVIECKIGAPLGDHQNPDNFRFWEAGGYGQTVVDREPLGTHIRYTVLGYRQKLLCTTTKQGIHLRCHWRTWSDLVSEYEPQGLSVDLFSSLAQLHIPEFKHLRSNKMKIEENLFEASRAGQLLTDTVEQLGFLDPYWTMETWAEDAEQWCFGVVLEKLPPVQGKSENHRLLMDIVAGKADEIAWFGYEPHPTSERKLSVWFYCGKTANTEELRSRLSPWFSQVDLQVDKGSGVFNVVVTTIEHTYAGDKDWFISVFEQAGLKSSV